MTAAVGPPRWILLAGAMPAVLTAVPVVYVAVRAVEAGPSGIGHDLVRPYTLGLLGNTLALAVSVTVLAVAIATAAAWATERCALPFPGLFRLAVTLPLAVPAYVSGFAWSSLGPGFQGMAGAVLILTLYGVPLVYLPAVAGLRGLDPALEDVARSLGKRGWGTFAQVVLPQLLPALGGGALLVATHMLAEFGALAFLRVETFTTAIYDQYANEFDRQAAALLSGVLMILAMPLAMVEARLRGGSRRSRAARGPASKPAPVNLGRWTLPVVLGLATLALLGFVVPLATLACWLGTGRSAGTGLGALGGALSTSLGYGLGGALATTLMAVPLAVAGAVRSGPLAQAADRLPYLVHGLPGIVVALAAVATTLSFAPALYQSPLLVVLAYAVLFLPLAQSALRASAELIPPETVDVARSLGHGPFRAFLRAVLPNLLPGFGAALALTTLQGMRELTATLLLAPAGVSTLATEFWAYTSDRAYGAAAPFAAALVLVSGVPAYLFALRTLRAVDAAA